MTSEWMVTSNSIGGKTVYAVYRLKDINEPDHAGNREFYGGYMADRQVVISIANELNTIEAQKAVREGGKHVDD